MEKIDRRIISFMMNKQSVCGDGTTSVSELEDALYISPKKLIRALKRLEKYYLQIEDEKRKFYLGKYDCRYQEICKHNYPESKTCHEDGGVGIGLRPYCGKYREYDKIFKGNRRRNLINKFLLFEISGQWDKKKGR